MAKPVCHGSWICCLYVTVQLYCRSDLFVFSPVQLCRPLHSSLNIPFMSLMLWIVFLEVLGALVSIIFIWIVTGVLVYMAIGRLIYNSYDIDASIMLITAAVGLAFNILWVLEFICTSLLVDEQILAFFKSYPGLELDFNVGLDLMTSKCVERKSIRLYKVDFLKTCLTVATCLCFDWMKCKRLQKILIKMICNLARISLYRLLQSYCIFIVLTFVY